MSPLPTEIPRVVRPAEPDDSRETIPADGQAPASARSVPNHPTDPSSSSPSSPSQAPQPHPAPFVPADAELEFLNAMQEYKRTSGRMFPTWSEVLEVLKNLGYEKPTQSGGPSNS